MSDYTFALFDPRSIEDAKAKNDKIFENAGDSGVLGIEVTIPALADRCALGNIDPQHSVGDATRAAIEVARECDVPPEWATLATVRADLDSVGAMAVIAIRAELGELGFAHARTNLGIDIAIDKIADADKFARGPWPGRRELPSQDNPWPEGGAASETRDLAAIAACVADFKLPIEDRVAHMRHWFLTGEEPEVYRLRVEAERRDLIDALGEDRREIMVLEKADGRIAFVHSTHRAAMMIGYCFAPVVVAVNPEFRLGGGDPHTKITIAAYSPEYADIKAALGELAEREPGWGGSPTIGGSPQGVSSTIPVEDVIEVVSRHFKG